MSELKAGANQKLMLLQMPDRPLIDKGIAPNTSEFVPAVEAVLLGPGYSFLCSHILHSFAMRIILPTLQFPVEPLALLTCAVQGCMYDAGLHSSCCARRAGTARELWQCGGRERCRR